MYSDICFFIARYRYTISNLLGWVALARVRLRGGLQQTLRCLLPVWHCFIVSRLEVGCLLQIQPNATVPIPVWKCKQFRMWYVAMLWKLVNPYDTFNGYLESGKPSTKIFIFYRPMSALGRTLGQIPRNGWHETRTRIQQPLSVNDPNSEQTMREHISCRQNTGFWLSLKCR